MKNVRLASYCQFEVLEIVTKALVKSITDLKMTLFHQKPKGHEMCETKKFRRIGQIPPVRA
jgi:hypothetical protein